MSILFRLNIMPYYAVRRGRVPGIYKTWDECKAQVNGFTKARYKKFSTNEEATAFVNDTDGDTRNISSAASSHRRQPMKNVSLSCNSEGCGDGPVVYTDGCCYNNGQYGAKAGIGVYWGPDDPRNVSERLPGRPTNNRAEIHAACRAIEQAKAQGMHTITVRTDSQFLINAATKWMSGWERNDWVKSSTKEPVKNKEDFIHLNQVSDGINIDWVHVRGHMGEVGNEAADSLANEGACKPLP